MELKFGKKREVPFLVLDIGTEAVKALFVKKSNERISIIGSSLQYFKDEGVFNKGFSEQEFEMEVIKRAVELAKKEAISLVLPKDGIKKIIPSADVALICPQGYSGILKRSNISTTVSPKYIHPHFKDVSRSFIDRKHHLKRKVNAWTVNRKEDLVELMNCGLDGIITDDPKTAVSLKEQLNSSVL